ncbi:hypothetical protein ACFYOK_19560 [Microbispora bryophytorum]|uniref:hypothetical protein n=1 Tax=Microbispora bryophytorum TaxID=1460882 RepID=UPI0036B98BC1
MAPVLAIVTVAVNPPPQSLGAYVTVQPAPAEGDGDGEGLGEGEADGLGDGDGDADGDGDGLGDGEGDADGETLGLGEGSAPGDVPQMRWPSLPYRVMWSAPLADQSLDGSHVAPSATPMRNCTSR